MHELSFLPKSCIKGIHLPKVSLVEYTDQNYGGYYDTSTIEIVVVVTEERLIASTLAHEFKHYEQHLTGKLYPIEWSNTDYDTYNPSIRNYFRGSKSEIEALFFEHKVTKSYLNHFWLKGLVLPRNFDKHLEI